VGKFFNQKVSDRSGNFLSGLPTQNLLFQALHPHYTTFIVGHNKLSQSTKNWLHNTLSQ
jgi:hypothetical protein